MAFLRVSPGYAVYLAVFFTIFMGAWISCVQVVFILLGIRNTPLLVLCTGACRVGAIVVVKRHLIRVEEERRIGAGEIIAGLFPAAACFIANLELYDALISVPAFRERYGSLGIECLVIFFALAAIFVLAGSETTFRLAHEREEREHMARQMEDQYRLFLREQEAGERLRALHHDLQNHLNTLEAMTTAGDVRRYIAALREEESATRAPYVTGNATLDALLLAKEPLLTENSIDFSCLLHLPNADFLSPMEICTLFANGIDNAVEAVCQAGVPWEERRIALSGGEVNGSMVVRLQNPYVHALRKEDADLHSTKPDAEHHGYGIPNMRRIVERHGGTLTYKAENGIFTLFFMIPMP